MGTWICKCGKECDGNYCPKCGSKCPEKADIESVDKTLSECDVKEENVFLCINCGSRIVVNSNNVKDVECIKCGLKSNSFDFNYLNASTPTIARLNIEAIPDLKIGDEFIYGRFTPYGQIKWRVIDIKEGKIEAICHAGYNAFLDHQPYNEELVPSTWDKCSLRRFLNEEFIGNVFSEEERNRIISTEIISEDNSLFGTTGGDSTVDEVFILSASEASRLIPNDYGKKRKWWLRTPGYVDYSACFYSNEVDYIGELVNRKEIVESPSARPVIWVDTSGIQRFTRENTKENISDYKKGNEIEYGFDPHRGSIKWRILDVKDDRALIISKDIFRERLFDIKPEDDSDYVPMWENCNIRKWLNGEFFDNFLTEEEKKRVLVTNNPNSNIKRYDNSIVEAHFTNDKVFLLSEDEAISYFTGDEERICEGCSWMLRTTDSYSVMGVGYTGEVGKGTSSPDGYNGIRPAMWIKC